MTLLDIEIPTRHEKKNQLTQREMLLNEQSGEKNTPFFSETALHTK